MHGSSSTRQAIPTTLNIRPITLARSLFPIRAHYNLIGPSERPSWLRRSRLLTFFLFLPNGNESQSQPPLLRRSRHRGRQQQEAKSSLLDPSGEPTDLSVRSSLLSSTADSREILSPPVLLVLGCESAPTRSEFREPFSLLGSSIVLRSSFSILRSSRPSPCPVQVTRSTKWPARMQRRKGRPQPPPATASAASRTRSSSGSWLTSRRGRWCARALSPSVGASCGSLPPRAASTSASRASAAAAASFLPAGSAPARGRSPCS